MLLSADTANLLRSEAAALLSYLNDHPAVSPERIADMLFRTRDPRRYRALSMVTDRDGLETALRTVVDERAHPAVVRSDGAAESRRRAYVLPGQGGQRVGMGALFYQSVSAFREEADRCDRLFAEQFGESPLDYLLGGTDIGEGTTVVQSALFMQMVALGAMWRSVGIHADVVIGHSQGEIAAAYLSGKTTLEDAVFIVGTRARAVETISSDDYAMAIVAADRDECESVLARQRGWAQVSVINSPRLVAISGERATVQATAQTLDGHGRFTRLIPVRYPAHTNAVNEFRDVIDAAVRDRVRNSRFLDSDIDCIGSTLGEPITPDLAVADYWFWNLRNTVRFDRAIAVAVGSEVDTFVELAEHPTLQFAVQENLDVLAATSATVVGTSDRTATDLSEFTRNLATLAVNDIDYRWDTLCSESDGAVRLPLLDFPNTQMNELDLWLPFHGFTTPDTDPVTEPAPRAQTASPEILVEQWIPLSRRSLLPPRRFGVIDQAESCAELSAALIAHAEAEGLTAHRMTAAEPHSADVDAVVVLLPALDRPSQADAVEQVATFFAEREWWRTPGAAPTDYWLVTVGGEKVASSDGPAHPALAAIAAGFRCIAGEYPDTSFRHLDLSDGDAESAPAIVKALHTADEPELALRDGGLYAKRLVAADRPAGAVPLAGRHVLITGGTGHVGLEFCEHAAREGARRVTLVSRSGETAAAAERLQRIRKSCSTDIQVIACDVADPADVGRLADTLRDVPADVVIHAVLDGATAAAVDLADLTGEQVGRALRGKALGIANVLDSVTLADECRVLLCSSTASVLGGRGKIMYAAANRLLDAYAQQLQAGGVDCISVQWGQWSVYQGQDNADIANLAGIGYLSIRSEDAIALGLSGLTGNAAVVAFDWDRARPAFAELGYGPTLSQLSIPEPQHTVAPQAPPGDLDLLQRLVRLLAEIIGVEDVQALDSSAPLVAVGLDSLNALQLRRRIKTEFSCEVAVSELLGGATLDDVVRQVDAGRAAPEAPAVSTVPAQIVGKQVTTDVDTDRIPSARRDLDLFGLAAMWRVLEPVLGDGGVHATDEIAGRLQFAERHHWVLRQWLHELVRRGFLAHSGSENPGYRKIRELPSPTRPDLVTVCSDLGYPAPFGQFLTDTNAHLADLVSDRLSVQELLFPDGSTARADAFYRDNVISRYLNEGASTAVTDTVKRLATDHSPVRIVELGAGVGGMTDDIVAGLTGLPVEYHFTDVSTFFLNSAQKRFADRPWMSFGIVDLNEDLGHQPPCDIVVAANVVHNAQDVGRTLGQIHDLLRPGGAVIFIEGCQAHCSFMTSVYFLMSPRPGHTQVGLTDVRAGTDRIFLTQQEWHGELSRAGFTPTITLPADDHPLAALDQFVFAAVRS